MKVLSIAMGLLLSGYVLMGCNSNPQGANSQDEPQKERTETPQAPKSNASDTNTVATTTTTDSTTQVMEGSLTELYQASGSNEAANANTDTEDTDSTLTSPGYRTVAGRVIYRAMLDVLKNHRLVAFHVLNEADRTFLIFDQGEDLSDSDIEKALKNYERIESPSITILSNPQVKNITLYPKGDIFIINHRLFLAGIVEFDDFDEDSNNNKDRAHRNKKETYQL